MKVFVGTGDPIVQESTCLKFKDSTYRQETKLA